MEEPAPEPVPVRTEKPSKTPRRRLLPAPIEQLTEFNVSIYLQNLPCGLSVGQAAHAIPRYRSGLARAVRRSREKANNETKEANLVESDDEPTSAAKCTLRIGQKAQTAIIDSGAATSIITRALVEKLGYEINRPSKMIVVTANSARTRSLGIIDNIPVNIGKIKIPTSFQVLESRDEILILGNDWLRENNANMSRKQSTLIIKRGGSIMRIPIAFTKTAKVSAGNFNSRIVTVSIMPITCASCCVRSFMRAENAPGPVMTSLSPATG